MHNCPAAGPEGGAGAEGFWAQALRGADLPGEVPFERWSIERAYAPDVAVDRMYARFAGFVSGVADFDAAAFRCCHGAAVWVSCTLS